MKGHDFVEGERSGKPHDDTEWLCKKCGLVWYFGATPSGLASDVLNECSPTNPSPMDEKCLPTCEEYMMWAALEG